VVAAAAYRSGERLDGRESPALIFDYRARGGVVESVHSDAGQLRPPWAQDRARLWNEAERVEARANGRLATEFELALPHELDRRWHRRQLVKDFLDAVRRSATAWRATWRSTSRGRGGITGTYTRMCSLTHRALDADGFGGHRQHAHAWPGCGKGQEVDRAGRRHRGDAGRHQRRSV
jgi:hypothetical protein